MTVSISQQAVKLVPQKAFEGQPMRTFSPTRDSKFANAAADQSQVERITIQNPAINKDYQFTISIDGGSSEVVSWNSGAAATAAAIAALGFAAFNNNALARAKATAVDNLDGTIDFTSITPGVAITIVGGTDVAVANQTANAVSTLIEEGRAVLKLASTDVENNLGAKVLSTLFTARDLRIDGVTGATTVGVRCRGQLIEGTGISAAALAADLDTNLAPVGLSAVDAGGNVVSITADTNGEEFTIEYVTGTGTLGTQTLGTTIRDLFWGFSLRRTNREKQRDSVLTAGYERQKQVSVRSMGSLCVKNNGGTITEGDAIFVGADASTSGQIFADAGVNRIQIPADLAYWHKDYGDGFGEVRAMAQR